MSAIPQKQKPSPTSGPRLISFQVRGWEVDMDAPEPPPLKVTRRVRVPNPTLGGKMVPATTVSLIPAPLPRKPLSPVVVIRAINAMQAVTAYARSHALPTTAWQCATGGEGMLKVIIRTSAVGQRAP